MNNSYLIRLSAIAAVLTLVALTSSAAAGRLPRPLGAGEQPLSAGVHVLDLVSREQGRKGYAHLPKITITLPTGWHNYNGWAVNDGGPLGLAFWDVDKVYPTACKWRGKAKIDPGRTVNGLARMLATRPLRHPTRPRSAVLGGFRGVYLRWSVPRKIDFSRCGQGYFESWTGRGWSSDRWQQGPGQVDRLWILDVNGKRLVIDANYMPSATRKQRTELDRVVHSIKFLSSSPPRSPASSARQSKGAWHRNTWNETRAGVLHAYFVVRPSRSREPVALLKVRTDASERKLGLGCRLRLAGRRRPAYGPYRAGADAHIVAFSIPSPLRRSIPATAICHASARIEAIWTTLGPEGDLDTPGRYSWFKLRRTGAGHPVRLALATHAVDLYHSAPVRVSGTTAGSVDVRLVGAIDRAGLAYQWSPYPWRALRDHRGTWQGLLPAPPLYGIYRLRLRLDHGRRFLASDRWLMRVFPHGAMRRPSFPTAGGVVRSFVADLPGRKVLVASKPWPLAKFDHRDLRLNRQFVIAYAPRGDQTQASRLGLFVSTVRNGLHGRWRLLEATTQPYG